MDAMTKCLFIYLPIHQSVRHSSNALSVLSAPSSAPPPLNNIITVRGKVCVERLTRHKRNITRKTPPIINKNAETVSPSDIYEIHARHPKPDGRAQNTILAENETPEQLVLLLNTSFIPAATWRALLVYVFSCLSWRIINCLLPNVFPACSAIFTLFLGVRLL